MQVHHEFPPSPPGRAASVGMALTIGTFDGVHRGHGILIEALRREAVRRQLTTAALTFEDMPYCFFQPDDCPHLLTLPEEAVVIPGHGQNTTIGREKERNPFLQGL